MLKVISLKVKRKSWSGEIAVARYSMFAAGSKHALIMCAVTGLFCLKY